MTSERFLRTEMLLGEDAIKTLSSKKVALFGLGGVGSYAAEAIARSGVGSVELIDADTVSASNINRQLCALESTVGMTKTDVVAARLADTRVIDDFMGNGDLTAELFLFKDEYPILSTCQIDGGGQSGRTAADHDYIV